MENLRIYKNYIDSEDTIFMEFNGYGQLIFLSNSLNSHDVVKRIKKFISFKSIEISDIFFKDK